MNRGYDRDGPRGSLAQLVDSIAQLERGKRVGRLPASRLGLVAAVERAKADLAAGGERAELILGALRRSPAKPASGLSDYAAWLAAEVKTAQALLRQVGLSAVEAEREFQEELGDPRVAAALAKRWRALEKLAGQVARIGAGASLPPEAFRSALRQIAADWNAAIGHTKLIQRLCEFCGSPVVLRHLRSRACSDAHRSRLKDLRRAEGRKARRATLAERPAARSRSRGKTRRSR